MIYTKFINKVLYIYETYMINNHFNHVRKYFFDIMN